MNWQLNQRSFRLAENLLRAADDLRIATHELPGGSRALDFGIEAEGGLRAGMALARICTAGLAEISLVPGAIAGVGWPHVLVTTDQPVPACLLSQYAGWKIGTDNFFAMGSGPMRAAAAREELFAKLNYCESPDCCVGVLEGDKFPDESVVELISRKTNVPADKTLLCIARTASPAGNFQVVARVVETALHKLFELGFDLSRISSGFGTAPLSPVAADNLTGIGRTNDAILYGGRVTLWVHGDDDSLEEIGPQVPADSSAAHGKPFLTIFEAAGRDFYQIDPHLFSPAEIVLQNLDSGKVHAFGQVAPDILQQSFGF